MPSWINTATSADVAVCPARTAILPIGSFEQHGQHLPLMTDTAIACSIANRLSAAYDLFLLPPITVSCSHEHAGFAGTVSIKAATLVAVVDDIIESLARSSVTTLVVVNGHGGNHVLSNVVCEHNTDARTMALFPTKEDWNAAREYAGMRTDSHTDMHGGELETSILLHTCPELVGDTYRSADNATGDRRHLFVTGMAGYTASGIIGYPSLATAAKGQAALDSLTAAFADQLAVLADCHRLPVGAVARYRRDGIDSVHS
ncbi:creatininase family protein [Nocardia wallacei]|uniref:creatininase family protein n=1 Tax=Nocardia wallacei TaxID=480035 RepID=UPI002456A797|nr:creatininase family protein [Nocardia wallacei]